LQILNFKLNKSHFKTTTAQFYSIARDNSSPTP
jgi:hypothetical protein